MKYIILIKANSIRLGLMCVVMFFLSSCDTKPIDSKVRAYNKIFWVDDDRIITVVESDKSCLMLPSKVKQFQMQILAFNTRNGEISWYGSPRVAEMCYANGNISYRRGGIKDGFCLDEYTDFYGMYGQEEKITYSASRIDNRFDDFNCKLQPIEKEALPRRLVEGHGWILGSEPGLIYNKEWPPIQNDEHHNYPIAIYPELDGQAIYIDNSEFKNWIEQGYQVLVLRYEKFKNAYLLGLYPARAFKFGEAPHGHNQFWWLYPDGRLEDIIKFEWQGDDFLSTVGMDLIPTKAGLFLTGGIGDPFQRYKNGLYKQTPDGSFKLILQGEIKDYVLSPNGCKLAFARNPHITDIYEVFYVQAIDLCNL